MMKILLVGHGRMGQLVESLAASYDCEIAGVVTRSDAPIALLPTADVAIDFSLPAAVSQNLPKLAAHGLNIVVGTTGWQADEVNLREIAAKANIGVVAAANFSIGVHVFQQAVETAAARFAKIDNVGAWIHEAHHATKKDAPSGTALLLERTMEQAGYARTIDVSSTRAGSIPGTHTVGFDGPAETVVFTHTVRDRAVFAHGALVAAKWLHGRHGWFTMKDVVASLEN
jgi:4-hydroxy-tetrahydrodipicolinate reductase